MCFFFSHSNPTRDDSGAGGGWSKMWVGKLHENYLESFSSLSPASLFFTTPKHLMLHYFLRLIFNAILLFSQPTLPHFFFSFSCVYDVDGLGKLDFNSWKKEREDSFINFVHALLNFLIYFVFSPLCIASSSRLEVNEFLWESSGEQEDALRKM